MHKEAIESYKQVIRIDPDGALAHTNLGVVYAESGTDIAEVHYNLGLAYGKSGKYQEAIESFKQALGLDPDHVKARYYLGATYHYSNDRNSALEQYKILKSLDTELANELFNVIYE